MPNDIYLGTTKIIKAYLGSTTLSVLNIGNESISLGENTPEVWTIIDAQNNIPVNIGTANMGDVLYRNTSNNQVKITLPNTKDGLISVELLDAGGGSAGISTSFKSVGYSLDWSEYTGTRCIITKSAELELTIDMT